MANQTGLFVFKRRSDGKPWILRVTVVDTDATLATFPALGTSIGSVTIPIDSGGIDLVRAVLPANTATVTHLRPIVTTRELGDRALLTSFLADPKADPVNQGEGIWSIAAGETFQIKGYA
jgi:hypothetical protein